MSLLDGYPVYPHLKITREEYPRILATRILKDDGDEYFGAFLNRTNVRVLMGWLTRTFKLRSCDIKIDGKFPVPCTQYFAKRCVAPCVAEICDRSSYLQIVDAVRLLLSNNRRGFVAYVDDQIEAASGVLNFELAAAWRDRLRAVQDFWSQSRYQVWLDDAVDTYAIAKTEGDIIVQLVTTRGQRALGTLDSRFSADASVSELLSQFVDEFYRYHLPRDIRIPVELYRPREVIATLAERFGRRPKISVVRAASRPVTVERAFTKVGSEMKVRAIKAGTISSRAKLTNWQELGLARAPREIQAFDVAHISSTSFVAAVAVWNDENLAEGENAIWISDRESEPETLAAFVARRLLHSNLKAPDLVLIDGGRGQLRAALKAVPIAESREFRVLAAVKPRGRHSEISHFLTEDERRVDFDNGKHEHALLKTLRDQAHNAANDAHRQLREMRHYYAPFGVEPFVVPIRFVEIGGAADDLIPIGPR